MTVKRTTLQRTDSANEQPVDLDVPLAGFSHCHLGILSQLQAFEQLPVLQAAAAQACTVAHHTLDVFKFAVDGHHADEENELFTAVLRSATPGDEAELVQAMVERLTAEHRNIESCWKILAPAVTAAAHALPGELDPVAVHDLVQRYTAHALFEEQVFFPLAVTILTRNGDHKASLGLSLHLPQGPL
ncbi:MAG: hemerythrin domain-containing protein [Polaromonas sp.]|nr:hemerythrin domain-containing protein [Polaromonas sp.]